MAGYAFASLGLEILKQSVLLVLYEARGESIPFLHPTEIGKRLDIPPTRWETEGDNSLILSILNRLDEEKRVVKMWIGTYKWQITKEGYRSLKDKTEQVRDAI